MNGVVNQATNAQNFIIAPEDGIFCNGIWEFNLWNSSKYKPLTGGCSPFERRFGTIQWASDKGCIKLFHRSDSFSKIWNAIWCLVIVGG